MPRERFNRSKNHVNGGGKSFFSVPIRMLTIIQYGRWRNEYKIFPRIGHLTDEIKIGSPQMMTINESVNGSLRKQRNMDVFIR